MSFIEVLLTVFAIALLIVGVIGCFVPGIPGPPLAWGGLVLAKFTSFNNMPIWLLAVTLVITVGATIFDYFSPNILTKKAGGSKGAQTGATVGIIVGLFISPIGIFLGPFIGAFIGEFLNNNHEFKPAIKVAFAALLSFLVSTGVKLFVVVCFIWIYIFSFTSAGAGV